MSSTAGEIYVGEVIRDACQERLDDLLGQDTWLLDTDLHRHHYILDGLPNHMGIEVLDAAILNIENKKQPIAILLVENEFYVEDMGFHKRIAVRPINIQIEEVQ